MTAVPMCCNRAAYVVRVYCKPPALGKLAPILITVSLGVAADRENGRLNDRRH